MNGAVNKVRAFVTVLVGVVLACRTPTPAASLAGQLQASDQRIATQALLDAYEISRYEEVGATLTEHVNPRAIGETLLVVGDIWVRRAAADGQTRRRLVAATFALEVARILIERLQPDPTKPLAAHLIEWGCRLMRDSAPTPDERVWHMAALAVAESSFDAYFLTGSIDPGIASGVAAAIKRGHEGAVDHLKHARERFPDEPRFRLVGVTAQEPHVVNGAWGWTSRVVQPRPEEIPQMRNLSRLYLELAEEPSVRGEALLRAGVMAFRLGDYSGAAARFQAVEMATPETSTLYLSRLLRGKTQERLTRIDDAEAAYRQALAVLPTGQAAAVALAALLVRSNRSSEVPALTNVAALSPAIALDPWRDYACGSCRHWPDLLHQLRRLISAK